VGAPAPADIQLAATEALDRWGPGAAQRLTGIGRGTLAAISAGVPVRRRTIDRARKAFEHLGWNSERLAFAARLRLVRDGLDTEVPR
jgi:hypothetical protein